MTDSPTCSQRADGVAESELPESPVLLESAEQPELGQPELGQPELGQPELGQPELGQLAGPGRLPPDPLLHWVYLLMAVGVLLLSFILRVEGEQRVVVPLLNKPLPEACTLRRFAGIGCPGCGLTRSFICLARGDVVRAWHFNPVGPAVALLVVAQLPYRIIQLGRLRRGLPEWRAGRLTNWILLTLALGLFLQWVVRLSASGF